MLIPREHQALANGIGLRLTKRYEGRSVARLIDKRKTTEPQIQHSKKEVLRGWSSFRLRQ